MTALITGASSGIGLELARTFARHKHDVVLVARQEARLVELAQELTGQGVRAHVIAADLSLPGAAASLVDRVHADRLQVDILVNNAGFGLFGAFAETALETELQMIQLNIAVVTELTKRFLPAMLARRSGRILNLASTAAFLPGPLMSVYYATKAYVLSFTDALANELEGTGVSITALCPGPTASGFQAAAHLEKSKLMAGKRLPSSQEVAEFGYDALMSGTPIAIPGMLNKLTAAVPRFFPRAVVRRMVRSVQDRRQ